MTSIGRLICLVVCIAAIAIAVPVILSGTLRSAYLALVDRKIASIWPPKYAFVGDSLTTNCDWRWEIGSLSVLNLAVGGTDIRDIARQSIRARELRANFILVEAGVNDVILESSPTERIGYDFDYLLQQIPVGQKTVVTLIPFVSDHSFTEKIEAANATISSLVKPRGLPIIDLNPELSSQGVRRPEMTTDGVHLTHHACRVWADEIRAALNSGIARSPQ
jgi:lysophospholipase L1-like esterase